MARRSIDQTAFRAEPPAGRAGAPTRTQAIAVLAVLVLITGAAAVASYAVKPDRTRSFDLFYGTLLINDERAPVAVDLANGRPTVRLVDANLQVSARNPADLSVVPLAQGSLLLNAATGEFNLVDATGFVVKRTGGGVGLPKMTGATRSVGVAAGENAYVVQTGPAGTAAYLVGPTTMQSALGRGAKVKPRAFATMPEPGATSPGAEASANGDLWLLLGSGATHTVRRLSVPPGSDAGVPLLTENVATVTGAAAIGVAHGEANRDVVAVASADRLALYRDGVRIAVALVRGLAGVDRILPASNQEGRLAFLYHSRTGWSVVSVRTDGSGRVGPLALGGLAGSLAAPASSQGRLYTMDLGASGRVWSIGLAGDVRTLAGYPIARGAGGRALEVPDFADAAVVARGPRVVVNSPIHVQAMALFTDGSHGPVVIDKSAATDVNAAGGAAALARQHVTGPARPRARPGVVPAVPINNKIDCKTTSQVPHIPTITRATPGSRSVQLLWTYPLLDPQDCVPSTYTVQARLLSAQAPPPPRPVTVQGQDGVTIGALFPGTRYAVTVTAYIHGKGTPSAPIDVTTGPEGPAAPEDVRTTVDDQGNWTVSWRSCGGVADGCVPSASWNLVPSFCDGAGLAGPPPTISVAGDPTQHTFTATYRGTDSLLGRGLSFHVEGIGNQGAVGAPAGDGSCSYSWAQPDVGAITLHASQPAATSLGGTTTVTVNLELGASPVRAQGGVGARFTYQLLSGGAVVQSRGPTTDTSVTFGGIAAGRQYTARAVVSPPRHPSAAVTVGPVPISTRAAWPDLAVAATFTPDGGLHLSGTLSVHVGGLSSAAAGGETFDLADSQLACGNTARTLTQDDFDPASADIVLRKVSLLLYHGTCTVSVALTEDARTQRTPPVFGGTTSPTAATTVDLGGAPTLGAGAADFAAAWASAADAQGLSDVVVRYTGSASASEIDQLTSSWLTEVVAPDGQVCAASKDAPTADGIVIPVDDRCLQQHGTGFTGGRWTVAIAYQNTGNSAGAGPFTEQVDGSPPTYQPK